MPTEKRGRRSERPPFWVAFGFISAFAATILTVVLTGLYVRAPGSQSNTGAEPNPTAATEPTGDAGEESRDESADSSADDGLVVGTHPRADSPKPRSP